MEKIRYLSPEYLEALETRGQALPQQPGASVDIQYVVRDAPVGGDIRYYFRIADGQLREARLGTLDRPMCSLSMSYKNSVKMTRGELNPMMGLMTGKIRPGGDVSKLRGMLPVFQSDDFRKMAAEVHEMTDY
jgi:hypothetical protein